MLAKHKNYVVVLLMLLGIAMSLALSSYWQLGRRLPYGVLIGLGIVIGPLIGILFGFFTGVLARFLARPLGGRGSTRNSRAVLAFGAMPIVFILVLAALGYCVAAGADWETAIELANPDRLESLRMTIVLRSGATMSFGWMSSISSAKW